MVPADASKEVDDDEVGGVEETKGGEGVEETKGGEAGATAAVSELEL